MKVYVCDTWDSLSDIGESIIDKRAYVTRDAAERRAERIRRSGYDEIEEYARVIELELCAEPTDADRLIAERTVWYLHAQNVEAENAKLRELVRDMWHDMPKSESCGWDSEHNHCTGYDSCNGECSYWYRMNRLGIEVDE